MPAAAALLLALSRSTEIDPMRRPPVGVVATAGVVIALMVALRFLLPSHWPKVRGTFVILLAWAVSTIFWAMPGVPQGLREWSALLSLVTIALAMVRVGWAFVMDWALREGARLGISRIWQDVTKAVLYLVAAISAARAAGADPRTLAATGGLVTAALTFSMQQTLGDLVAGVLLQSQAPFKVGDWISYNDNPAHIGRVVEVNWRATKVTTLDRVEITVPNSLLAKSPIVNYSEPIPAVRRGVHFWVGYEVPPPAVQRIAEAAARSADGVLDSPPVSCVPLEFTDRGVRYWLRFFIEDMSSRDALDGNVRSRLWHALKRAEIPFALPRMEMSPLDAGREARKEQAAEEADRRAAAFANVDVLRPLPATARSLLAERARTQWFAAGETVFRAGEKGSELYFVARGRVAVITAEWGRELGQFGPGDFFGEIGMLTGEPRSATVRVVEDAVLYVVDKAAFEDSIAEHRGVLEEISRVIAARNQAREQVEHEPETHEARKEREKTLLSKMWSFFGLNAHGEGK